MYHLLSIVPVARPLRECNALNMGLDFNTYLDEEWIAAV